MARPRNPAGQETLSFPIPGEMHTALKLYAIQHRTTMGKLAAQMLEEGMRKLQIMPPAASVSADTQKRASA